MKRIYWSRVSGVKRDPIKVRSLLRSIARNTATLVDNKTLEQDVKTSDRNELSRNTISEYLDALSRLMILYEQPAFNPHIRSSAALRKSPKRHLCDTSLATHELNVYAKANDATIFHYNDSYGLEIDNAKQLSMINCRFSIEFDKRKGFEIMMETSINVCTKMFIFAI